MKPGLPLLSTAAFVLAFSQLVEAQAATRQGTSGRYVTNESVSVQVTFEGDSVTTTEHGRTTSYTRDGENEFIHTTAENKVFGIRVVDAKTLQAFRRDIQLPPTKLTLLPARSEGDTTPVDRSIADKYDALAKKYFELAQTDPANTLSWVSCAAAATQRSLLSEEDADAHAVSAARTLKMLKAAQSPCTDVITVKNWAAAGGD